MIRTIEELVELFIGLPLADEHRWTVETIVRDRLHLSRGLTGEFAVFLEGSSDSFGQLPTHQGVEHSDAVTVLPQGRRFAALRIASRNPDNGNRIIAHIAYELARRLDTTPEALNSDLISGVSWVLPLLGEPERILAAERQYGLVGECVLLQRLLSICARLGLPGRDVLKRWKGSQVARRDFVAHGLAIEVKTTSQSTRIHHIGSIEQLDKQTPEEQVFLCSIGLRLDHSAPKKLPDFIADVEAGLVSVSGVSDEISIAHFREQLRGYGYHQELESFYRSQPGIRPPHLPLALYPEAELERVRLTSFKGDRLPGMVVSVGYNIDVRGDGLSVDDTDAILSRLLVSDAVD